MFQVWYVMCCWPRHWNRRFLALCAAFFHSTWLQSFIDSASSFRRHAWSPSAYHHLRRSKSTRGKRDDMNDIETRHHTAASPFERSLWGRRNSPGLHQSHLGILFYGFWDSWVHKNVRQNSSPFSFLNWYIFFGGGHSKSEVLGTAPEVRLRSGTRSNASGNLPETRQSKEKKLSDLTNL